MSIQKNIQEKIQQLAEKYSATGQDLSSYLEGLLYADYLSYWEYIHLDTLLSLQNPKTDFPDENIFIIYHQITELYFKLIINELEQITNNGRNVLASGEDLGWNTELTPLFFKQRMTRIIRYFENLIHSFDIMIDGMDNIEFIKFRMALLPGSGFQSVQFRSIELYSTPIQNLVKKQINKTSNTKLNKPLKEIYWQSGATEEKSGKKTYTLTQFNKKYSETLTKLCVDLEKCNVWEKFKQLKATKNEKKELEELLRKYDYTMNVKWKLIHFKSAAKHFKSKVTKSTGGTNWEKYLPPRFQKIIFYPKLWSKKEKEEWGLKWLNS